MGYYIEDLDINVIIDGGDLPPMASQVQITDTGNLYTATTVEGALQEAMTSVNTKANQSTTYTKTEVDTALNLKANRVQESWITLTLTNGWLDMDTARAIKYRKDQFGRVHIKGSIKSGTLNQSAFTLPVGYRPLQTVYFGGNANNSAVALWTVETTGAVFPRAGSTSHMGADCISFFTD